MFVGKQRQAAAVFTENLDDLLKQLVARIHFLPARVFGVVAVLADQQHRIDCQIVFRPASMPRRSWDRS